jgi:alkylation response protein AidB-like acyl-CoA dehydrogenase
MGANRRATDVDTKAHVVTTIFGGTTEIQKEIVARSLGL